MVRLKQTHPTGRHAINIIMMYVGTINSLGIDASMGSHSNTKMYVGGYKCLRTNTRQLGN